MKIDHCEFPDDLLYDADGLVWARFDSAGDANVGITSIYAALAGRPGRVAAKSLGETYHTGRSIGMIESARHVGAIRTPLDAVLLDVNPAVIEKPRTMTDAPYGAGWFARLRPLRSEDHGVLRSAPQAQEVLARQITALRVRCFAAVPDHAMHEIGVECAAVLVKLNELLARIELGEVVHLVTDDPTAPIEMVRWSDQTGQPVIDERKEGGLFHFLVRKVA